MTYSKEAMDKALELLNAPFAPAITFTERGPGVQNLATYIQQVSDAVKRADEEMAGEGLEPHHKGREALKPFILSDPVDPLLREAREIVAKLNEDAVPAWSERVRKGRRDDHIEIRIALAALKSRENS